MARIVVSDLAGWRGMSDAGNIAFVRKRLRELGHYGVAAAGHGSRPDLRVLLRGKARLRGGR